MYIQDLAGVAHDDIDPSVFSSSSDEQMVRCPLWFHLNECFRLSFIIIAVVYYIEFTPDHWLFSYSLKCYMCIGSRDYQPP